MTAPNIIEQENEILRHAIDQPGHWTIKTISKELDLPKSTLRSRLGHLRAVGYLEEFSHKITATDCGRVAYYKRTRIKETNRKK